MNRLLVPTAALLWGLHAAFLSPALALILVSLFGATTSDVVDSDGLTVGFMAKR